MTLGSDTAAVLLRAMDILHLQMSPTQHALLTADERKAALHQITVAVETAAKLAEVAHVDAVTAQRALAGEPAGTGTRAPSKVIVYRTAELAADTTDGCEVEEVGELSGGSVVGGEARGGTGGDKVEDVAGEVGVEKVEDVAGEVGVAGEVESTSADGKAGAQNAGRTVAVVDWRRMEMEKGNTGVVVVSTTQELRWVVVMVDKITHDHRSATQEVERAEAEATEAEVPEADGETVGREAEKVETEVVRTEVEGTGAEWKEAEGTEADGETIGREAERVEPETSITMAGEEGVKPVVKKTAGQSWWLSAVEKAIESAAKERERMRAERERIKKVAEEVITEEGDKGCVRTRARGYSGPGKR